MGRASTGGEAATVVPPVGGEAATVVPPIGGRLVAFDSRVEHEVLPAHARRCRPALAEVRVRTRVPYPYPYAAFVAPSPHPPRHRRRPAHSAALLQHAWGPVPSPLSHLCLPYPARPCIQHAHPPHVRADDVALHEHFLRSALRTRDPDAASLFFVPVYLGRLFNWFWGRPPCDEEDAPPPPLCRREQVRGAPAPPARARATHARCGQARTCFVCCREKCACVLCVLPRMMRMQ